MKHLKFLTIAVVIVLVTILALIIVRNSMRDYIIVTEERGNICTYDADGKLQGASLATGRQVKVKVLKVNVEQYKKDAIASRKCFH